MTSLDLESLRRIQQATAPYLHRTPMLRSDTLSRLTGHNVFLKAELFQKTGSYKPRGMLWALLSLAPEQRARGVITFSSGNAAQGLAYAGQLLQTPVTVAMPAGANPTKVQATRDYGAEVVLHGTPQECQVHCRQIAAERGLTYIASYDDMTLMQGHATLAAEVVEDVPQLDALLLGVGGGGMLGGTALGLQACGHPAQLIGVEPEGAPGMQRSLAEGRAVSLDRVDTIADGLAAPGAGALCYDVARDHVHDLVVVSDAEIVEAMKLLMQRCKLMVEPSGAAALAGLLSGRCDLGKGANVVCVVSGGNLDLQRLKTLL